MATENTLSQQLLDLLATRNLHPEMLDRSGRPTDAPEAKTFTFDYEGASGKNYGTMVIVLDSDNEMKIMYGDNLGRTMEGTDKNEFFDFIQHLSKKATMNRWTHTIADISQLKHTMQGLAAIQEGLFEGYYGNRNISYAGAPTQARLKIKHSQPLGENDARFRHVESLFVETADGECFRLGFRNLSGGRAMLEHVRQGGKPYDIRGCHLTEMVNEIATLARFNRASAGRVLEGVTQEVVSQAQVYYKQLRENLKRMSTSRGYSKYFESWHPADITQQEELVENIKTLFVEQTIDARIEQALPLLAKIQQGHDMKEAKIFESWINNLAEGTWNLPETPEQLDKLKTMMASELIVGPDAINATEQLYDLVGDDILFDRLSELADRDPRANAWNDTEVMNRLAELGIEMPEPSVPGNPAEPATAPVAPVAAAPAAPAVPPEPVAEDSPLDKARQRVQAQGFAPSPEERNAERLARMQDRERDHARHQDKMDSMAAASMHADQERMNRDTYDTQRRKDDDEDTRKTFDMFRDRLNRMQYKNQRDVDPEQLAKISAIKYESTEGTSRGVDAKGRTQSQWIQMVKAKFPDGKMIQAKMPDGPVQVTLPDGRKLGWSKVEQAVAEGQDATTYTVAYKDPNKPGKSYSTQVKATSAAEAKAAFQDWDDTGRFTYLGSRPDVDTVYEAVAEELDPEHVEYLKRQADISRSTGLAVGDRVTLKDRPGFEGEIVHDWGGGDFSISGSGGGMSQSKNHRANARLIQKIQGVAEESSENKYSNLSSRGVNRGINRAGDDFDRMMDLDQVGSPHYKTQHQQDTKQRLKTKPMAGPKGHLPEQDMAESAELNTMLKYAGIPVAESRVLDEAGETIDHVLNRFKHEVKQFEQGNDLDSDLYEALFDYYSDAGEMPYGVAKARTGDPFSWVSDKLADHLGVNEGFKDKLAGLTGLALAGTVALGSMGGGAGAKVDSYAPDLNTGVKGSSAVISNPGDKKTDIKYQAPIKGQSATIGEADPISTFEVMSGFDAPVAESSCNMTA